MSAHCWSRALSCDKKNRGVVLQTASLLAGLLCVTAPALAEAIAKPAADKWRPKNGIYASAGSDVDVRCREFGDFSVDLGKKSIVGDEWTCKITKLTDTAQDAIRLNMTCSDYNLVDFIGDPNPERKFKEVMLFKKVNETMILFRKTLNGKFKDPDWKASYCPDETQRLYTEAKARDNSEAKRKAAEEKVKLDAQQSTKPAVETPIHNEAVAERSASEEKTTLNRWRPQDGIYATPGANFEDRCLKGDDATIGLTERSISSGADRCNVTFIRDEPNAVRLFVTCDRQQPNAPGSTASRSSETVILRKAGDKTILMQRSTKGEFIDSGRQLAYCGPDVQKARVEQKAGK